MPSLATARLRQKVRGRKKGGGTSKRLAGKRALDKREAQRRERQEEAEASIDQRLEAVQLAEQKAAQLPKGAPKSEGVPALWKLENGTIASEPTKKPGQGGCADIVADWELRGSFENGGVAYHEPKDLEMITEKTYANSTTMGLAYQVSSLSTINSVDETFAVVIDLNIMYKIKDADKAVYEEYRDKGTITFQELQDDIRIKSKPPIWEFRNTIEEPEQLHERITVITQGLDQITNTWCWYVILYVQVRATCFEEFEMNRFPFTRNCLQVHMQVKQPFQAVILAPLTAPRAMPMWLYWGGQVRAREARANTYKCDKTTCNWIVENHHVAFTPFEFLPPMPSGNKFGVAIITIQCKQSSYFYLWNTVPVVVILPLLTALAFAVPLDELGDRMGAIVLVLLLTMAAYKVSVAAWMPQKEYLTWMDWYVIAGFNTILVIGLIVGIASLSDLYLKRWGMEDDNRQGIIKPVEEISILLVALAWIFAHIYFFFFKRTLYLDWADILREENKKLKELGQLVTKDKKIIDDVVFRTGKMPDPPPKKA